MPIDGHGDLERSPAIVCRGLVKRYDTGVLAVDGLDLVVERGECFGLLGPNGAGKTTTVEVLEGLLEPTGGAVEIFGMSWGSHAHRLRERLGITLQETRLFERLTVGELVDLFRSFYRRPRSVDEVLGLVSLEEKRGEWYERLSGGQRQRLAVACALVADPELLFLDEPTTGLDPQSRRQLWDVVVGLKRAGRTVLLTTHYMDEAERLCDRVAIVDHGKVIALGTPRELIDRHAGDSVIEIGGAAALGDGKMDGIAGVKAVHLEGDLVSITVEQLHDALPLVLARLDALGVPLTQLVTRSGSLDDVFLSLTGRRLRE